MCCEGTGSISCWRCVVKAQVALVVGDECVVKAQVALVIGDVL